MKTMEDFEFEALLSSVVEERVAVEPPVGLAQRLVAWLLQAAAQMHRRAPRVLRPSRASSSATLAC